MKKKNIFILLASLSLAAILTACGTSSTSSDDAEHEAITIMDAQRDYTRLIELVNEKYPEINVEVLPYRGRNMSAFAKQQLETGSMPDIYSTTQAWDEDLQAKYLLDLSDYAVTELYTPARIEAFSVDGSVYLLPFDYTINGIGYNQTLFEKYGIEVPDSLKELREETIPALNAHGIKLCDCLLDLPGTTFQYFFNICSTTYMNTLDGRNWRSSFSDTASDTYASGDANLLACADYVQEWIDYRMLNADMGRANSSEIINEFTAGNTAFFIGSITRFSQNEDGTGDQYGIMPYLSRDGSENMYITQNGRLYGLNKELAEPGNEQKLEDALHFLEVLSTTEGYLAINGENSTNMCSISDFKVTEDSPYVEALRSISLGHSMDMVYTGWDSYLVPFGEALYDWIAGTSTATEAFAILDDTKRSIKEKGTTVYATVTEELDTVQAAELSGQMFLEATGADAALISYNVYSPDVHALMENSYGANGVILEGDLTEEYITIFLPTGWYDTLQTAELSGAQIKEMADEGCDTRGTGFHYPYVLLAADGKMPADDETYTVVLCGYNKSDEEALALTDTGIVGLDAAKDYLLKVGEVSLDTLDDSLVQMITGSEE